MPEEKEVLSQGKKGILDLRLIIVAVAIIILCAGIAYVVAKMVVTPVTGDKGHNSEAIAKTIGPTYDLDEFTVNLAGSNGKRFIKSSMIFVISDNSMRKELDEKRPLIRDRIIMILGEKEIKEIETTIGKEKLKQEIISDINNFLITGQIQEMFFDSFVFN